jgi:flagellin-like protein
MNIGKSIRKFRRNMRAISPVIATLLMIAIAVVASLVTYAWVMGYMNFTTEKTGKAIQIQSTTYSNPSSVDTFTIYVQNVGDSDVKFGATTSIFINGAVATSIAFDPSVNLGKTNTVKITASGVALDAGVQQVTIKVVTLDGTFAQVTKQFTVS